MFEITVQIELVDRTAEFTVEKKYSEIVGILKIMSKDHSGLVVDCEVLLRDCLEESAQSFKQEERDRRLCLQLEKLLNIGLASQGRQLGSCSRIIKSFLSVTHLTFLEIEQ